MVEEMAELKGGTSHKYKNLFSNFIIFGIGSIGSKLVSFLLVPLYTNYLSSSDYGISDLVLNLSYLLIPVVSLTFQDSILRFGLSKDNDKKTVLKNSFLVFLFCITLSFCAYPLLGLYEPIAEWRFYLITIMITTSGNTFLSYYAKIKEKNKLFAIASITQAVFLAFSNFLLIVCFSLGIKGFLLSNVFANIASFVLLLFFSGAAKDLFVGKPNIHLLKQMLIFSIPLIINNISWWVLNSSDKMMIEHYIGASQLGVYTASSKIPNMLSLVTSIFASAWSISSIKEYDSTKDYSFYRNIFKFFSLTLFFGGSVLLMVSRNLYFVYVGKEYHSGWICVPLLICGILFFSISSFFGSIYAAAKKNLPTTISTIISGLLNITLNLLMLKSFGIVAAALSTFVSYFFIAIYRMFDSRRFIRFRIDFLEFFINCSIVIFQMVLIMNGFNSYTIGLWALFVLTVVNHKAIKRMLTILKNKVVLRK